MTGYMGYLGSASVLTGMWFIGRKWRFGFLLGALGEVFWFTRGYQASETDLMALAVVFTLMNLSNWLKWGRARKLGDLLYSQRRALTAEIDQWIVDHKAAPGTEAVLAFLSVHNVALPKPKAN